MFGASCHASWGPVSSENRAHRPGGDGESCPRGVRSLLLGQWGAIFFREPGPPARGRRGVLPRGCSESPARPMGGHLLQRTGRTGPGGTGSPAQGVFGVSCQAYGGPSSSENRAHRPGGDGESSPGGVRSLLPGQWGAIFFREPGAPARGGRGVLPRGCSEPPARANGGPSSSDNRAHRPGGDGESCPGGVRSLLPGRMGGHLLQRTGRTGLGGTGSPAQGVFGVSCQAYGGPSSSENRAHRPGGDGESSPGGVRSLLPGQWGAIFFREPGAPARGGQGVLPRGCSEPPARANGGPSSSENRAHRPGGDGESCPGGVRSLLPGQWGAIFFREPGAPARGGRGVLPRGCSEPPARANGGPSSSENRAHRPGGDGESCPGGVRSLLPGLRGAIFFREPGAPAWGGRGVQPRGCSEPPARPMGGHLLQRTGRTGPGGTGSPAQGVFGASCQGQWGAIFFGEPGAPAWGGRGVLPRGCSESPARANGGPSSSENRAHRPGGDGESCPGGVRSLLPGQWGAIFFREPGAPARGGRGVLPRGCSESPARPMGGHLLQRTGRTGPGGTGSPAQGVFGASCKASGGPVSSENRAHRPGGDGEPSPGGVRSLLPGQWGGIFFREPGAPARGGRGVLSRGCSEPPARPVGGYLPSKPPSPSPTTLCSKAVGQQYRGS